MIKKIFSCLILILFYSTAAHAGFNGLTHHSRANCVNNESISWDATRDWEMEVDGLHYQNSDIQHVVDSVVGHTWRAAAVCWGEGKGGWTVRGNHFIYLDDTIEVLTTDATDCNIYDGWWDKDPPPHEFVNK